MPLPESMKSASSSGSMESGSGRLFEPPDRMLYVIEDEIDGRFHVIDNEGAIGLPRGFATRAEAEASVEELHKAFQRMAAQRRTTA